MAPEEGLHFVFGGHGLMDDFPVPDFGNAHDGEVDRFIHRRKTGFQRQSHDLLFGRQRDASRLKPLGQVFEAQFYWRVESVLTYGVDGHRGGRHAANNDFGRDGAKCKIGQRSADAEAVGIFLASVPRRVAEVDEVFPICGRLHHNIRISVVGVQPRSSVIMIVVHSDDLAVLAGDFDE